MLSLSAVKMTRRECLDVELEIPIWSLLHRERQFDRLLDLRLLVGPVNYRPIYRSIISTNQFNCYSRYSWHSLDARPFYLSPSSKIIKRKQLKVFNLKLLNSKPYFASFES